MSTTQQVARPTDPTGGRPVVPSTGALRPLGLSEIALTGGFWSCRQRTNAQATLAHCQMWMERLGWVANFDRVADATTRPDRPGLVFSDSEIYKLLEAMAWEFGRTGDLRVDAAFRALSERVVRAQDADGYLNTSFGHGGQAPRYCDLAGGHELVLRRAPPAGGSRPSAHVRCRRAGRPPAARLTTSAIPSEPAASRPRTAASRAPDAD